MKSGRAVAVAIAGSRARPRALHRRDVALCDPSTPATRQPYHAALGTAQEDARVVERLSAIVRRAAAQSIAALVDEAAALPDGAQRSLAACLVVGSVIDPDTVGNPHIRAHANEGRLFRTVVEEALRDRGVGCRVVVEKQLRAESVRELKRAEPVLAREIAGFGRAVGGPWRADEKAAALGAWLMLK